MNTAVNINEVLPIWQELQQTMPLTHIEDETQYHRTIEILNVLLDHVRDDRKHPLYTLISVLGDIIESYESNMMPIA